MNVKCAKEHISKINNVCGAMANFLERHMALDEEWIDETWFMDDAVMFLSDYKKALEKAIEEAELKI